LAGSNDDAGLTDPFLTLMGFANGEILEQTFD